MTVGRPNLYDRLAAGLAAIPADSVAATVAAFDTVARREAAAVGYRRMFYTDLHTAPTDLTVAGGAATVTIVGVPAGAWTIAEYGTGRHTITPRRRQTATGRPPAIAFGGGHPLYRVEHKGSPARHAWSNTLAAAADELVDVVLSAVEDV